MNKAELAGFLEIPNGSFISAPFVLGYIANGQLRIWEYIQIAVRKENDR